MRSRIKDSSTATTSRFKEQKITKEDKNNNPMFKAGNTKTKNVMFKDDKKADCLNFSGIVHAKEGQFAI